VLLSLAVAGVAVAACWSTVHGSDGTQFGMWPDGLEYAAGAQSIADSGRYYLQIGEHRFQPRYAPGWPLVLAGALLAGVDPEQLAYVPASFAAAHAVLVLWVAFFALRWLAADRAGGDLGPWAGAAVAGLAFALAPLSIHASRHPISDTPAALLANLALVCAVLSLGDAPRRRTFGLCVLAGAAAAAAAAMRPVTAALLVAPAVLLAAATWVRVGPRSVAGRFALVLAGATPVLVAVCALLVHSGYPFWRWTAYAFWVPEFYTDLPSTFALSHAFSGSQAFVVRGAFGGPQGHATIGLSVLAGWPSRFFGLGNAWPALAWLSGALLLGTARRGGTAVRSAVLALAALASWPLVHFALFSLYFYPAARFYLAPAALACAGLGIVVGAGLARSGVTRVAAVAVALGAFVALGSELAGVERGQGPWQRPEIRHAHARVPRWLARSDAARAARPLPFDPLVAQALGYLPRSVADSIGAWGALPRSSDHVARLYRNGHLRPPPAPAASSTDRTDR